MGPKNPRAMGAEPKSNMYVHLLVYSKWFRISEFDSVDFLFRIISTCTTMV